MKSKPKGRDEYTAFTSALQKILRVSHTEMQTRIQADKQGRKRQHGKRPSSRVSSDKG